MGVFAKSKRGGIFSVISAMLVSILTPVLLVATPVYAETRTWTGGGGNNNLATAGNWSGGVAPGDGDDIVIGWNVIFPNVDACDSDVTLNNNLNAGSVTLASISITGERPEDCFSKLIITGNDISLSGNVSSTNGTVELSVGAVTATAPISIGTRVLLSIDELNLGSNNVTLNQVNLPETTAVSGSGNLTLSSETSGGGSGGGCSVVITGTTDNSGFSGSVFLEDGAGLVVDPNSNGLAQSATSVGVTDGSLALRVPYGQNMSLNTPISFAGGSIFGFQGQTGEGDDCVTPSSSTTITITSGVVFTANTDIYLHKVNLVFSGSVTGGNFAKLDNSSSGTLTIGGQTQTPQRFTTEYKDNSPGTFILVGNNETAIVTGTYGDVSVQAGGILKGTGTVGEVWVSEGGIIAPGLSPGCLNSGGLSLSGTLEIEIAGNTVCTQYDQQIVTGAVVLHGSATLDIARTGSFWPKKGDSFTIINNDGSDAVTGTFKDLREGATFTVDGVVYKISYAGGSGNDVVLTVQSVPGAPDTGFALVTTRPALIALSVLTIAGAMFALSRKYAAHKA